VWGLIWTPVQLYRNIRDILRSEDLSKNTPQLELLVRAQLADDLRTHRLIWPPSSPR
jgi:hypothetical protein